MVGDIPHLTLESYGLVMLQEPGCEKIRIGKIKQVGKYLKVECFHRCDHWKDTVSKQRPCNLFLRLDDHDMPETVINNALMCWLAHGRSKWPVKNHDGKHEEEGKQWRVDLYRAWHYRC